MANYTLANLVVAQQVLIGEFASNDQRFRIPATFKLFLENTQNFFGNYKALKESSKRAIDSVFFAKNFRSTVTTGMSHNHTGGSSDSAVVTLAWTTHSLTFSLTLKQANDTLLSFQELLNNEIRNCFISFANSLDIAAANFLFANKSGVNPASVKGTFNATKSTYEIVDANFGTQAMTITKTVLDLNRYQGMELAIVCDSYSWTTFLQQAAQGAQNATNLSFQFMGISFVHSPQLTALASALDPTYIKGYWLAVPKNTIACLDWIPKENRNNTETKVNMYSSIINPIDGLQYATHSYQSTMDGTTQNGDKQDVGTQTQMFINVSFNFAPSTTANETPIFAFALK